MGVLFKHHRFREAGEIPNVNNVERFGTPHHSLFTTSQVFTLHRRISITDDQEQVVYQAQTKFPSLHDKTDITDASGNMLGLTASIIADLPDTVTAEGITAQQAEEEVIRHETVDIPVNFLYTPYLPVRRHYP